MPSDPPEASPRDLSGTSLGGAPRNITDALLRGAGLTLAIQVAGLAVGYLQRILFARWLGVEQFGVLAFALATMSLLTLPALLGWPRAMVRLLPELTTREAWGTAQGVIRGSARFCFATSVGLSLVIQAGLAAGLADATPYAQALRVAAWLIPLFALTALYDSMARGVNRMGLAHAPTALARPLGVMLLAALAVASARVLDARDILWVTAFVVAVTCVAQRTLFWRGLKPEIRRAKPRYDFRAWLAIAVPMSLAEGAQTLMLQFDVIMLGTVTGPEAAGVYSAISRTVGLMALVVVAVNAAAAPLLASAWTRGDRPALESLLRTAVRWSFWPSLAVGFGVIAFSDHVLSWFGPDFTGFRQEVSILVLGRIVNLSLGSVMVLMSVAGEQNACARVLAATAAINVVLNALLIPKFGMTGAALATAFSTALWKVWLHRIAVARLGLRFSVIASFRNAERTP